MDKVGIGKGIYDILRKQFGMVRGINGGEKCVNPTDQEKFVNQRAMLFWRARQWIIGGGKLVENIVQAIARDCLSVALLKIQDDGYKTVMHVHDEGILEVDTFRAEEDLETVNNIMGEPMPWAPDLPLKGDGYVTPYYKKD